MARNLPFFRWFPADAEIDGKYRGMDDASLGFFHRCLNYAWSEGGLPADPVKRARDLGRKRAEADKRWKVVGACWVPSPDDPELLVNPRQERERSYASKKSNQATDAVRTRYEKPTDVLRRQPTTVATQRRASVALRASDSDSDSGVLDSTTETKSITREEARWTEEEGKAFLKRIKWKVSDVSQAQVDEILSINPPLLLDIVDSPGSVAAIHVQLVQFEDFFWKRYWRKADKKAAREAWLKVTGEDLEVMADAIAGMEKQLPVMLAKEEQYRPHATTWLRHSRWNDEVIRDAE